MNKLTTWDTYYFRSGSSSSNEQDVKAGWDIYYQNNGNRTWTVMLHPWFFVINSYAYSGMGVSNLHSSQRINYGSYQSSDDSSSKVIAKNSTGSYGLTNRYYSGSYDTSGNASLYIQGSFSIYMAGEQNGTYSRSTGHTFSLPNIGGLPANVTAININNITMNSCHFDVSTDAGIDYCQHSLNGGGWTGSGNQVVSGLSPGTYYTLAVRVRRTDTQVWSTGGPVGFTTIQINNITSSLPTSITNETELVINVSRPSGSNCDVYIELLNDTKTDRLGTYYINHASVDTTTTFTAEELATLAQSIPNDNKAVFRVNCLTGTYESTSYRHTQDSTYNVVNSNPTFTDYTFKDNDTICNTLTGSDQILIKNKSDLNVAIINANKMVSKLYATPIKYRLNVGTLSDEKNYSDTDEVDLNVTNCDAGIIYITAIDSRGNNTQVVKTASIVDYKIPVISSVSMERQNGIDAICNFKISGTYQNVNFGAKQNTITKVQYSTDDGTTWTDITSKISYADGSFSNVDGAEISGFATGTKYNVTIQVSDGNGTTILSTVSSNAIVSDGAPTLDLNTTKKGVGVGCISTGKGLYLDGNFYIKISDGTLVPIITIDE